MTELVFVHGVGTRSGPDYDRAVANRDALLTGVLFEGEAVTIHTPIWGDLVPAIDPAIFSTGRGVSSFSLGVQPLGMGGGMMGAPSEGPADALAAVARANPTAALDAVYAELVDQYDRQNQAMPPEDIARFAAAATAIAADEDGDGQLGDGRPAAAALTGQPGSDDELQLQLRQSDGGDASFGVVGTIRSAIGAVTDRLRSAVSKIGLDPLVDHLRPAVGLFLGDVFAYLHDGAVREGIRDAIRRALVAAHDARGEHGKLVVIGHSLGGVILADMLSDPGAAGLPDGLHVDVLVTVGSQPGLFQSLRLFGPAAPPIARPAGVDRWFNVFDPVDPLAFRANPIWPTVADLAFDSITGIGSAHTTYFKRPQFYGRCRKRLIEAGVIGRPR